MARYIDAEKYPCKGCPIEYCYENCKKFYAWLEGCDYDVEAKVAELEKVAFERFGNDGMGGQKVVALDDAVEIVQ